MKWIEIDHSGGSDRINLERCDRMKLIAPTQIAFYFGGTTLTLTFSTAADASNIHKKLLQYASVININKLA